MNKRIKVSLMALGTLVLLAAGSWQLFGASLTDTVKQKLIQTASTSVNGSLSVGTVDFSASGSLTAKQVELKDKTGALVASVKTLSIDYDLSDLFGRRLDIERVRSVTLDGVVLNLDQNKQKQWNATTVLKSASPPAATPGGTFRGNVFASNAAISVTTPDSRYQFKNLAGTLDFAKYPEIGLDLKTKDGASILAAKGSWNFSGGGNIMVTAEDVDPAAYATSVRIKGPTSFQATLAGTTANPSAKGTFKIPSGTLGDMSFSNASGDFSFVDSTLSLANTKLNAFGGSIQTHGPVHPDTLRYAQKVSGQNLDSSMLSDKDIQGRLAFSADVEGQGPWEGANADGTFEMGAGSVSGISFDALSGNFAKRGANTRYYNLTAKIAGQSIYIGDAESLNNLKLLFKAPLIPGLPGSPILPGIPKTPASPGIPKLPSLPKLF
jgi:hypothetical protein